MPPPFNFPSDSNQRRIIKAFQKIGFVINSKGGKGSHVKVIDPKTGRWTIIQSNIHKAVIRDYVKFVEKLGYDVDNFIKKL